MTDAQINKQVCQFVFAYMWASMPLSGFYMDNKKLFIKQFIVCMLTGIGTVYSYAETYVAEFLCIYLMATLP